jgi:hypothetical protein
MILSRRLTLLVTLSFLVLSTRVPVRAEEKEGHTTAQIKLE